MYMNKEFSKLCTPAKIYFAIALFVSMFELYKGVHIMNVFVKLLIALIWTVILGWLCSKGFKMVSWFLVLLPYILITFMMLSPPKKRQDKEGYKGCSECKK